ncbi:MAG: hypothetical protein IJD07_04495 [Clostridia bacterium]|nr:hypothetical protein [Clostridia bacterium]
MSKNSQHGNKIVFFLKNRLFLVALCLMCATALSFGGILGKYVLGTKADATAGSLKFYFGSNLLTEDCAEYTLNSDATSVDISLFNYADVYRYSADVISYTITVTGDSATLFETSDTIAMGSANSDTVTISGLVAGKTYIVTATATMPKADSSAQGYKKVLSAKFTVKEAKKKIYYHADASDDYVVYLTVWTDGLAGTVNVQPPAGLIPDNTWEGMADVQYEAGACAEISVSISKNSSHTFRFFKDSNYVGGAFVVKLTDSGATYDATESTPL